MRGPSRFAPDTAVRDRVRRLRKDTPQRVLAQQCIDKNDTLGALHALYAGGDVTEEHIEAHKNWIAKDLA